LSSADWININENIQLSSPSLSGSSSITGGNSASYTATNNSY